MPFKNIKEKKEYDRQYYLNNRNRIIEHSKLYYAENKKEGLKKRRQYWIDNKDKIAKQRKQYYKDNAEEIKEYQREYIKNNPEKAKESRKQYYYNNIEKMREANQRYRHNNSEKLKEHHKQYYRTGNGKAVNQRCHSKRRAREKEIINTLTAQEWLDILEEYNYRCAYCDVEFEVENMPHKDHVIPITKGGHNVKENIVPACQSCNSKKGTKIEYIGEVSR